MYKTSEWWQENQKRGVCSIGKIRVIQAQINQKIQSNTTLLVSDVAGFCNANSILEMPGAQTEKYITLEENISILDGTGFFPPSDIYDKNKFGRTGYVSQSVCNGDGFFANPIVLEIRTKESVEEDIKDFTIQWSKVFQEYPKNAEVIFYKDATQVGDSVQITSEDIHTIFDIKNRVFNRIKIVIRRWCLPHRRARIEGVWFGGVWELENEQIQEFSCEKEIFEDNKDLWINEVRLKIREKIPDEYFGKVNAPFIFLGVSLQDRLIIEVGFKDDYENYEMIPLGTYYVSNLQRTNDHSINIVANDILSMLKQPYKKSTYNHEGLNVYELVESMLIDSSLQNLNYSVPKYYISESFRTKKVFAPLPFQSVRECLQLLAQEMKAYLYVDRYGSIHFEDESDALKYEYSSVDYGFHEDFLFENFSEEKRLPVKEVVLKVKQYTDDEKEQTIYQSDVLVDGTKVFWFSYNTPSVLVSSEIEGGVLENATYYTHGCEMRISSTTKALVKIKIKGFPLIANNQDVRFFNEKINEGEFVTVDNLLKTSWEEGDDEYYLKILNQRKFTIPSIRVNPSLDVLDRFTGWHGSIRINSIRFSFQGMFRGSISGVILS